MTEQSWDLSMGPRMASDDGDDDGCYQLASYCGSDVGRIKVEREKTWFRERLGESSLDSRIYRALVQSSAFSFSTHRIQAYEALYSPSLSQQ